MAIINATPHAVNVYATESVRFDAKHRKYIIVDGCSPIHIIPPSGMMLSAKMETLPVGSIDGIPVQQSSVIAADPLPSDDNYIVSRLFHSAMTALGEPTERLLLIGSPVYRVSQDGAVAPVGCLALERG